MAQKVEEIVVILKNQATQAFKEGKISVEQYKKEIEGADRALKQFNATQQQTGKGKSGKGESGFMGGVELEKSGQIGFSKQAIGAFAAYAAIRQLGEMAKVMNEVNLAYAKGEISASQYWGKMREEVAASIPVFGEGWKAGRQIRELFTHEEANDIRLAESIKRMAEATQYATERLKERIKATKELVWTDREFERKKGVLTGTQIDTYERTEADRKASNESGVDSLNKQRQGEIDKLEKVSGPSDMELDKARRLLRGMMEFRESFTDKQRNEAQINLNNLEAADQKAFSYKQALTEINERYDKRVAQQKELNQLTDEEQRKKALEAGQKTIRGIAQSNTELRAGIARADSAFAGDDLGAKLAQARAEVQKQLSALSEETADTLDKLPQSLRESYKLAQDERRKLIEESGQKREQGIEAQDWISQQQEALSDEKEQLQKDRQNKPGKLTTTFDALSSSTLTGVGRMLSSQYQSSYEQTTQAEQKRQTDKLESIDSGLKSLNRTMQVLATGRF